MMLVVGVTGVAASGKGVVISALAELAIPRGVNVLVTSLSEHLRRESANRGEESNRDIQKAIADEWRYSLSSSVLGLATINEIETYLEHLEYFGEEPILVLVDSIRNPKEVFELRTRFAANFRLVAIVASPQKVAANLLQRKRGDEAQRLLESQEARDHAFRSELGVGQPRYGHDVASCIELADWPPLYNEDDYSLSDLRSLVIDFGETHILPILLQH